MIGNQHLLGFSQAELPRQAGVLDGRQRARAGAAVVAGDQHHVGVRLGDAGGDGADTDFGHELHVDARVAVGVLQIVNQLRQIFDRVDVVVRRRRNQADAGRGVTHLGDPRINLVAGQLAALAGLGALRHLDLQVGAVHQVMAGDAEASRGHLLHARVALGAVASGIFAAFAAVRTPAHAVHRDRQRLVRLGADGTVGHGAGGEARDDALDRLDLVDRNRLFGVLQIHQPAQRREMAGGVIATPGKLLEQRV